MSAGAVSAAAASSTRSAFIRRRQRGGKKVDAKHVSFIISVAGGQQGCVVCAWATAETVHREQVATRIP